MNPQTESIDSLAPPLQTVADTIVESLECVSYVDSMDSSLLVVSQENEPINEFRTTIADKINTEMDTIPTVEIRQTETDDDSYELIAIIGINDDAHPAEYVTLFTGLLELNSQYTYQALLKTGELVDEGAYRSQNPQAFAAAVIHVLSYALLDEPLSAKRLTTELDIAPKQLQSQTVRIIKHIEK